MPKSLLYNSALWMVGPDPPWEDKRGHFPLRDTGACLGLCRRTSQWIVPRASNASLSHMPPLTADLSPVVGVLPHFSGPNLAAGQSSVWGSKVLVCVQKAGAILFIAQAREETVMGRRGRGTISWPVLAYRCKKTSLASVTALPVVLSPTFGWCWVMVQSPNPWLPS